MATTLFGNVKTGSTSLSLDFFLIGSSGTPDTGKVAADLTAYYYRQGASATTSITLSDLSTLNSSFSSGGIKEIGDGCYRIDYPDAMWASGAFWTTITIKDGSTAIYKERFALEAHGADDINTVLGVAGAGLTALGDTRIANLDAAVSTRSTYSGGAVASVTGAVGSVTTAVTVGTNNDKTGYSLTTTPPTAVAIRTEMDTNSTKLANLDAAVSTRSTYSGGAVSSVTGAVGSVTSPVTVGTNNDKTGYSLTTTPPTAIAIRTEIDNNSTQLSSLVTGVNVTSIKGTTSAGTAGYMGIDWSHILNQTATVGLTNTTTASGGGGGPSAVQIRQEIDANSTQLAALRTGVIVTTNSDKTGYSLTSGQTIASVTNPVTVGTVNDKSGYHLAATGLDLIAGEGGSNLRQMICVMYDCSPAGIVSGVGTGTTTIYDPGGINVRAVVVSDDLGNRSAVSITPPT